MMDRLNESTVLFLVNSDLRAVRVSYEAEGRNKETIKKTLIQDLKVGDFVMVETDTRWNAAVCKVVAVNVEIDFDDDDLKVGWVFGRVDLTQLDALRETEKRAVSLIREARLRQKKAALLDTLNSQCGEELLQLTADASALTSSGQS